MPIRKILKKSKDLQTLYNYIKVKLYKRNRTKAIDTYIKNHSSKKLHLGCGSNVLNDWINTDFSKPTDKIIFLDVTETFPFEDNTFDFILAEHLIEHISYNNARFMLSECYRILKKGGCLRISTPDLSKYLSLYKTQFTEIEDKVIKQTSDYWIYSGFYKAKEYVPATKNYSPVFVINDIFYNYEHKFIYDCDILKEIILFAGFKNPLQLVSGFSDHKELNNIETHTDDVNRFITLTIEAQK